MRRSRKYINPGSEPKTNNPNVVRKDIDLHEALVKNKITDIDIESFYNLPDNAKQDLFLKLALSKPNSVIKGNENPKGQTIQENQYGLFLNQVLDPITIDSEEKQKEKVVFQKAKQQVSKPKVAPKSQANVVVPKNTDKFSSDEELLKAFEKQNIQIGLPYVKRPITGTNVYPSGQYPQTHSRRVEGSARNGFRGRNVPNIILNKVGSSSEKVVRPWQTLDDDDKVSKDLYQALEELSMAKYYDDFEGIKDVVPKSFLTDSIPKYLNKGETYIPPSYYEDLKSDATKINKKVSKATSHFLDEGYKHLPKLFGASNSKTTKKDSGKEVSKTTLSYDYGGVVSSQKVHTMKRIKKYGMGSTISSVGSLLPGPYGMVASGVGSVLSLLENNTGLPAVNENFMAQKGKQIVMDLGGEVPTLVEKDEVVRTPSKAAFKVEGGTHDSGNDTLIMAEPGTEVYSSQITVKGKTMADLEEERMERSAGRLRRMKKIMKKLEEQPDNFMIKAGASRESKRIEGEEMKDRDERLAHMEVQEILGSLEDQDMGKGGRVRMGCGGRVKKAAMGDTVGGIDPGKAAKLKRINDLKMINPQEAEIMAAYEGFSVGNDGEYFIGDRVGTDMATGPSEFKDKQVFDDASFEGEDPAASGKSDGSSDPYKNAARVQGYSNAAAMVLGALNYKPIPDFSTGYGQRGLAENAKTMSTAAIERDMRESDLSSSRASGLNTIRNSSRGANEYLAKALGLESTVQDKLGDSSNAYVKQINESLGQRGRLFDAQDTVTMKGRETQFTEQEKLDDNMIENFATATKDIGLTEQQTALYDVIKSGGMDPESLRAAIMGMLGQRTGTSRSSRTRSSTRTSS